MSKRNNPEQRLQIAVAQYLGHALRPPTIWTAFPAGGGGRIRGAFLKAMGLKAGWPDIVVMHPLGGDGCQVSVVVGIELKAAKGRLSPSQTAMHKSFYAAGARYDICRSLDEVEWFLKNCRIPLHASASPTVARAA